LGAAAGVQRATWDGRDARGARVGAGAYFVRLDSAWGTKSRMLVRL
jgi:flagellar hook assembly protein FlgD